MPNYHPPVAHYDRGKVQLIDFLESGLEPAEYRGYLKGQVIKYVFRAGRKGDVFADLEKANVYLTWLLEFERKSAHEERA